MPFPNEHSCRLRPPEEFEEDSFRRMSRRHEGKRYSVIVGRLKGETTTTEQAFRYPKDNWAIGQARAHCQDHDGTFEAATGEEIWVVDSCRDEELAQLRSYQKGSDAPPILYRGLGLECRAEPNGNGMESMIFVASDEIADRFGDVLTVAGWQLDNFRKNPVFLYAHDAVFPPIGTVTKVEADKTQLLATVRFDDADPFANTIHRKYKEGFMRGVSVGFRALEFEDHKPTGGILFKKQELVELSAVPIPANPRTLKKALGHHSQFWIPFVPVSTRTIQEMRGQLEELKADINEALAAMPEGNGDSDVPPEPAFVNGVSTEPDWSQILQVTRQIIHNKGGNTGND